MLLRKTTVTESIHKASSASACNSPYSFDQIVESPLDSVCLVEDLGRVAIEYPLSIESCLVVRCLVNSGLCVLDGNLDLTSNPRIDQLENHRPDINWTALQTESLGEDQKLKFDGNVLPKEDLVHSVRLARRPSSQFRRRRVLF